MASVFRAFLERLVAQAAGTFVGDKGDLFFDPDAATPTIKISDGVTPGGRDISSASGGVQSEIADAGAGGGEEKVKCSSDAVSFETQGTARWNVTSGGHILPVTNSVYDLGSAEYKVRHLFLSSNSLWIGDDHKVDVEGGKMKFRKRKKDGVPKKITDGDNSRTTEQHTTSVLAHASKGSLTALTTADWTAYANSRTGTDLETATIADIWPSNSVANKDDYEEITEPATQEGHDRVVPVDSGGAVVELELRHSNTAIIKAPNPAGFALNIHGAASGATAEGSLFEATINVIQGNPIGALNTDAISVNGEVLTADRVTVGNTPNHLVDRLSTYKIYGVFITNWKVTVVGYPE